MLLVLILTLCVAVALTLVLPAIHGMDARADLARVRVATNRSVRTPR